MTDSKTDSEIIAKTHNTARFFTESRHIAWVLAVATLLWGIYGYSAMAKRKDPWFPARYIVVICPWPGADAEKVEQQITRTIEEKISENPLVRKIESVSRNDVSIVSVEIDNRLMDTAKQFDDIRLRVDGIRGLPQGAGPIEFLKDFDETCALMLTVASPKAEDVEISLRAREVRRALESARARASPASLTSRITLLSCFPRSIGHRIPQRQRDLLARYAVSQGVLTDVKNLDGSGFVGIDAAYKGDDESIQKLMGKFRQERLRASQMHPDEWPPIVIRNPDETYDKIRASAGDKYSYKALDDFADLVRRKLQTIPQVARITRLGALREQINLDFSQERVAAYAELPDLRELLSRRNINEPVGSLESSGRNVPIRSSGELTSEHEIGDLLLTTSPSGAPVYMRDVFEVSRGYETPARYLNFYNWRDNNNNWHRTRAITLAIQMRNGEQIAEFGAAVDGALLSLKQSLPADLILARVSDQPLQVAENVDLFMMSLFEAVILVVLVTLIGFWEWRSAVLIALSIPLTLAMTFGMMHVLGIDFQQVSIASLIIALGLLVDDPVVAGDAIKRELAAGHPPPVASWLGPTKLSKAILFATLTNIAAYLPLLAMTGRVGQFIHSLPIVLTVSLVSSRIVSMTFVPLLGSYLLRVDRRPRSSFWSSTQEKMSAGYYRLGSSVIKHRWLTLVCSLVLLASTGLIVQGITIMFFPKDLSYLSYVDVWLPEGAPLTQTNESAKRAEDVVRQVCARYGQEQAKTTGKPPDVLDSITTFIGGGGPRFWYSVTPELEQLNYAQLVIKVKDKYDTAHLVPLLQEALSASVPGTCIDVRQLETGPPINMPVSVRVSGQDIKTLRQIADKLVGILRSVPQTARVRDDWDAENFAVKLDVDADKLNLAGFSNHDVANVSLLDTRGRQISSLREGDKQIPIVARLRAEEGGGLGDIQNLYVYSPHIAQKIPLRQVAKVSYGMQTSKIRRHNQFRAISVSCFPVPGVLPSKVLELVRPQIDKVAASLPPGYWLEFGGEEEEQIKCYADMPVVMAIMIASIFICLVFQFKNALKPLIVFAGIPYGFMGALAALVIMRAPLSFMAVLGIASLVGVIVSHVIVLLDFIEEGQSQYVPLEKVLLDACLQRFRPVMITVAATVFALVPLAAHGGPLWEPLCYAEMGGLTVATAVTLVLVPVLYAIFALDLKLINVARVRVPLKESQHSDPHPATPLE